MRKNNPDCYECIHHQNISRENNRSCCNHPDTTKSLKVKGNTFAVRHGWFKWPFNFDPAWLTECNGFER